LKKKEFSEVFQNGRSRGNGLLVVYLLKRDERKIGIVVSKRVGKAVVRNKIKRRLYNIWQQSKKDGWVVVIARPEAVSADFERLKESFLSLIEKIE
jgi:ribonuclease P protein component